MAEVLKAMTAEQVAHLNPESLKIILDYDKVIANYTRIRETDIEAMWDCITDMLKVDSDSDHGYDWNKSQSTVDKFRRLVARYPADTFYIVTYLHKKWGCEKYATLVKEIYAREEMLAEYPDIDLIVQLKPVQAVWDIMGHGDTQHSVYADLPLLVHDLNNVVVVPECSLKMYQNAVEIGLIPKKDAAVVIQNNDRASAK